MAFQVYVWTNAGSAYPVSSAPIPHTADLWFKTHRAYRIVAFPVSPSPGAGVSWGASDQATPAHNSQLPRKRAPEFAAQPRLNRRDPSPAARRREGNLRHVATPTTKITQAYRLVMVTGPATASTLPATRTRRARGLPKMRGPQLSLAFLPLGSKAPAAGRMRLQIQPAPCRPGCDQSVFRLSYSPHFAAADELLDVPSPSGTGHWQLSEVFSSINLVRWTGLETWRGYCSGALIPAASKQTLAPPQVTTATG